LGDFKATRWAKEKFGDVKETVQAAKVITRLGMKKPKAFMKDPEKAIIDFLNDILVLFLIRLHWNDITQNWLVKPLKYRYEWMALFYMFFLLVRSRKKSKYFHVDGTFHSTLNLLHEPDAGKLVCIVILYNMISDRATTGCHIASGILLRTFVMDNTSFYSENFQLVHQLSRRIRIMSAGLEK